MRLLILLAAAFAGCATTPIPADSAKPVPPERLLAFQAGIADGGTLVVTRDVGYLGSACFSGFWINGEFAARFGVGETAKFFVPEGEVLLRTGVDPQGGGLCGVSKDQWTQRETISRAGETRYFRLSSSPNGMPDVQRTER